MQNALLRRYFAADVQRIGPRAAAETAVERIHGKTNEFVLHLDVDVIAGFEATNYSGPGGLTLEEVRDALDAFAAQPHLAAIEVTGYNPAKDADASGAKLIVELLAGALAKRLAALTAPASSEPASVTLQPTSAPPADEVVPAPPPGEAWSSDDLASPAESPDNSTVDESNSQAPELPSDETEERNSQ